MASRPRRRLRLRLRRSLFAALVAASVAVPVSGAARPSAVPAPAPVAIGPVNVAPAALAARYAAQREGIRAAERAASGHGDRRRAAVLSAMAGPDRRFLAFDGRDGGRAAEVFGDLSHADRIAVLVPGSDTGLDRYERFRADARELRRQLGDSGAVVAWLGYQTPATPSAAALTAASAESAAPALRSFVAELAAAAPATRIAVLCHSYGSVVCARAASGLKASDIVLYGSPGTGVDHVRELRTRATVWAGRGSGDWIADVPHVRLGLHITTIGFGADPVSDRFGARRFDAGACGHSGYLRAGSVSLRNIARIVSATARTGEGRA
ncbi:alpha/beta hydrolase [Streptomyces sp. NBC_00306]|uniref:alpha/beta hydrolase n=1 Tax=Streptomyces sp. NBC_00306 TaxID=2975708 RepID=UPI002E2B470D|nr:alpha/beta hydrolase [Streptomyces sp. NBC_00306]